ncbi:MAG TPA: hypothetical protein VHB98_19245, partial [Chloroflexota bacterium]|nr:hypothetical protein [Chloroflexota bacterium]
FYTISKAAHDAWNAAKNAAPPGPIATFPSGTVNVGYFLSFSGATPNVTRFQIIQRDASGGVIKGDVHTLPYQDGSFSNYFSTQPAFAPGVYTFELLLNGVTVATTQFKIKSGIVMPAFYSASKSDIAAWQNSTAMTPPRRTKIFSLGTNAIGYFFSFSGVKPRVTTFRVNIYAKSGALFLQGDSHTVSYVTGYFSNYFYDKPSFPGGLYTMKVLINGVVARAYVFIVGG